MIYSGISMMYMVLQVHISIEATNSRRTSGSRQALIGAIGGESTLISTLARGTEGNISHTSSTLTTKIPAAIINITVKP
ncbi:hypothetical protein D3C76_1366560 [compost metagenome]